MKEELFASAATELARLQPALDSKHVDSLVNAVTQKGGPHMIRDLIVVCDTLSKDSYVVGRQTAAERHASSIVRGLAQKGDLFSAVDFLKKLKIEDRAVSPSGGSHSRSDLIRGSEFFAHQKDQALDNHHLSRHSCNTDRAANQQSARPSTRTMVEEMVEALLLSSPGHLGASKRY